MQGATTTIKKFQFFDIEQDNRNEIGDQQIANYENVSPSQMYAFNQIIFLSGKVKTIVEHSLRNENLILKIRNNVILDQYLVFNKMLHYFVFQSFNSKHYFVTVGMDIDLIKGIFVNSIKIYEVAKLMDPSFKATNKSIDQLMVKQIFLLQNTQNGSLITSNKEINNTDVKSLSDIISFSINKDFTSCALGLEKGQVILIQGAPNLLEASEKNIKARFLPTIDTDLHITNLAFTKIYNLKDDMQVLYATTRNSTYYFKLNDKNQDFFVDLNPDSGAYSGCIAVEDEKLVIAPSVDTHVMEYINLERGPLWFFDGKKQFTLYFKNYLAFSIYEEKSAILAIFDRVNKFFGYYYTYSKISCICHDDDFIYAFVETDNNTKQIVRLKEKDNKYKFEIFYRRSFFENAYEYAKNLGYDKKKICEISKRHGDHLCQKGDYAKAIDQYILTINYLDPSYVIQKFLDGSKLDYLIQYLECLHKDDQFKSRDPDEMKDYTALLLNCYIKQKKIPELRDFVEKKNVSTSLLDVETAIEVCKDTNQIPLALSIAEKAKMVDYYIQLLIDFQKSYDTALEYLEKIPEMDKRYQLSMKYGSKFLTECPLKTIKFLKSFITAIINQKKTSSDPNIKYENLIKIFLNQETLLEDLLDYILANDPNCDQSIIHRRIELYLDRMNSNTNNSEKRYLTTDNIIQLIKDKKYTNKIDKNYVLMLFKMYNFTHGIITLSDMLELRQELLSIYMDNQDFEKIINICENHGRQDNNFWVQALNYFINVEGDKVEDYIKIILNKIGENELLSPILVLEILRKKSNMKYETVKQFIINALSKEKKNLDIDKKEFEANYNKLEKINNEINEIKMKARVFNMTKCGYCQQTLQPPVVYFLCNDAFHMHCLNAEIRDDVKDINCPKCVQKNHQIQQRIKQSEEQAVNHNNFFIELGTKQKKFDFIAKFLGKGIFKMDD